jgi:hypothetical protein
MNQPQTTPAHPMMMKCGHTANAVTKENQPCCVICAGIIPGAYEVADTPDLTGRTARCLYCAAERSSALNLPFFKHNPAAEHDEFYSGCRGWD